MGQFCGDSYRAPTAKRLKPDDERDNLKRDLWLSAACVADFIESPAFAFLAVVLLEASNRCDTDIKSFGGWLGGDMFWAIRAAGAVVFYGAMSPFPPD
jgi:hypothetical protein